MDIFLAIGVLGIIWVAAKSGKKDFSPYPAPDKLVGFLDKKLLSLDFQYGVGLCFQTKEICFVEPGSHRQHIYPLSSILETRIEVRQGSESSSSAGNAFAGWVILGLLGAIAGAAVSTPRVTNVEAVFLKIVIRDHLSPIRTILLYEKYSTAKAQAAIDKAKDFEATIMALRA